MADPRTTIRVRMYRQGLGDCHLVTILEDDAPVFRMLIDCGVYQTVSGGAALMREIVEDVIAETGGRVDVLAVTHEHWDHVSGFNQAKSLFALAGDTEASGKLSVGELWMGWTEDPDDPVARRIVADRAAGVKRVASAMEAASRFAAAGQPSAAALASGLRGVLGFFGGAGRTTADALDHARSLVEKPRYQRPGEPPIAITSGVRAWILGPPRDVSKLYLLLDDDETYGFISGGRIGDALFAATEAAAGRRSGSDGQPFDAGSRIAVDFDAGAAPDGYGGDPEVEPFLARVYFGVDEDGGDQAWRRIDGDWLGASREFALKLDNATNNTSLVVLLELVETGRTLLFAADAQVGSWLSWMDLKWTVDGEVVTGPDLLSRAAFLKVGHHGSHNATLRRKGLERMAEDLIAFIPTDEAVAKKVGWGAMPLPGLVRALEAHTGGRTVRADRDFEIGAGASPQLTAFSRRLRKERLFYEIDIG